MRVHPSTKRNKHSVWSRRQTHRNTQQINEWMSDCWPKASECAHSLFLQFGGVAKTLRLTIDEIERTQNSRRVSYVCACSTPIHSLVVVFTLQKNSKCAIRAAQTLTGSHKWRRLAFAHVSPCIQKIGVSEDNANAHEPISHLARIFFFCFFRLRRESIFNFHRSGVVLVV